MKLGIKVGLWEESFHDLELTNAPYCEVWFNANEVSKYEQLFSFLKKRSIDVGLHFWGALPDGTWTNFVYPDSAIISASLNLMKKTIDIAAQNHFSYVNIHPGTRMKAKIDFVRQCVTPTGQPVDAATSEQLFLEHAQTLHEYATNRGVIFTIETAPLREAKQWSRQAGRLNPVHVYQLPADVLIKAANQGLWVANDFCHTAANKISDNRTEVWNFVEDITKTLAPQTKLIHVGFVVPPYNGTDFHDHLDNPLLDTDGAVPNKNELRHLLRLFKDRNDVWAIVEPVNDHPKNYFLLQKLLK